MSEQVLYIVTTYGCNSSPSELWIPMSKLFTTYEDAYSYFLKVSPSLDNKYCKADQYINCDTTNTSTDYVVIENRVQISGYHYGDMNCAKRPEGAVISRTMIKN